MKFSKLVIAFCLCISFFSCEKTNIPLDNEEFCKVEECVECADTQYQDLDLQSNDLKKVILAELYFDNDCGCFTKGLVKWVKDDVTVAIVDYGDGTCDRWATKKTYLDEHCPETGATYMCCKFDQLNTAE